MMQWWRNVMLNLQIAGSPSSSVQLGPQINIGWKEEEEETDQMKTKDRGKRKLLEITRNMTERRILYLQPWLSISSCSSWRLCQILYQVCILFSSHHLLFLGSPAAQPLHVSLPLATTTQIARRKTKGWWWSFVWKETRSWVVWVWAIKRLRNSYFLWIFIIYEFLQVFLHRILYPQLPSIPKPPTTYARYSPPVVRSLPA